MSFRLSVNETNNIIKVRHAFSEDGVYEFPYTGKIVDFTVSTSGIYKIEAWGARGADGSSITGPLGAYSKSFVNLIRDEKVQILVGEKGNSGISGQPHCGGGGGGTFIAKGNIPLCVAGGGGTLAYSDYSSVRSHACGQATQLSASFGSGQASLRMGGLGAGDGGGGGGFEGNGYDGEWSYGKGGISFLNGGTKQTQGTTGSYAYGGFGGGGSRHGNCGYAAGGGGYTGGSAGSSYSVQSGGGGSYFEGNYSNEASYAVSGCNSSIPPNPDTYGNGFAVLSLLKSISNDVQVKRMSYCYCFSVQLLWTLYSVLALK
jgi:hypothetical protein